MWSPNNQMNATITYDFKNMKVKLTSYTFHTPTSPTKDYPKSWEVECSNDGINWVQIDERRDEMEMNGCCRCYTFSCSNNQQEFFQYVRFKSKGPCWASINRFYFDLSAIELYGYIHE